MSSTPNSPQQKPLPHSLLILIIVVVVAIILAVTWASYFQSRNVAIAVIGTLLAAFPIAYLPIYSWLRNHSQFFHRLDERIAKISDCAKREIGKVWKRREIIIPGSLNNFFCVQHSTFFCGHTASAPNNGIFVKPTQTHEGNGVCNNDNASTASYCSYMNTSNTCQHNKCHRRFSTRTHLTHTAKL